MNRSLASMRICIVTCLFVFLSLSVWVYGAGKGVPLSRSEEIIIRYRSLISADQIQARRYRSAGTSEKSARAGEIPNGFAVRPVKAIRSVPMARTGAVPSETLPASQGRAQALNSSDLWVVQVDPSVDVKKVLAALEGDPAVLYAEPNQVGALCAIPSDPLYSQSQADLALIGVEQAWDAQPGANASVKVAVIDSGVEPTHPDLASALDIANSWNFVEGNAHIFDDIGHGTRVAGIIGAVGNNAEGIAGIAYGCKVLSLDVASGSGTVTVADVAAAISHAVSRGASIACVGIRFSAASQTLKNACDAARDAGLLLIAPAGNEGQGNAPVYPAVLESVMGVGAVQDDGDTRAPWSNYNGLQKDLAEVVAPGDTIFSAVPGGLYNGLSGSGTSYAAAVVAGSAALLKARHPEQTGGALRHQLRKLAAPLGEWAGWGRISLASALQNPMPPQILVDSLLVDDTTAVNAANDADGRLDVGETANLRIRLRNSGGDALNLMGSLQENDPELAIASPSAVWGGLAYNATDALTVTTNHTAVFGGLSYQSPAPVAKTVPLVLLLSANGGYSTTLPLTLNIENGMSIAASSYFAPQTWTKDRTWEIMGNQSFNAGLTIEPGTVIKIAPAVSININGGTLTAKGSEEEPILFTRLSPTANWGNINIKKEVAGSTMEYCTVEYAATVLNESPKSKFSHCTFRKNSGWGLQCPDIAP